MIVIWWLMMNEQLCLTRATIGNAILRFWWFWILIDKMVTDDNDWLIMDFRLMITLVMTLMVIDDEGWSWLIMSYELWLVIMIINCDDFVDNSITRLNPKGRRGLLWGRFERKLEWYRGSPQKVQRSCYRGRHLFVHKWIDLAEVRIHCKRFSS